MRTISRREAIKTGAMGALGLGTSGWPGLLRLRQDELVFRPYPHAIMPPIDFAYPTDVHGDPFQAPVSVTSQGVVVPREVASTPFGLNARWYVEGFGYVWLEADNGGNLFTADDFSRQPLVLNYEFARSRVARNAAVMERYARDGAAFSAETRHLHALSQDLLEEAGRRLHDQVRGAALADRSLLYALWTGEKVELEKARQDIERRKRMDEFLFGCETRQYVWAKSEAMTERFVELFNYATVTHYIYDTWYEVFEPREGEYRWGIKDNIVDWLLENDITVEGRPLLWFHSWVTPDWLKEKNFSDLKEYVVNHVNAVVGHYGDRVLHWEVVNEYHDWANVHRHTPEQMTEIVRLACETTHDVNPRVERIINNCCPFGSYVAGGRYEDGPADRPLRTPRKFIQDLVEADVPFDVLGIQVYFPQRDLSDIVRLIERFEGFGKPIHITEMGASSGPTKEDVFLGQMEMPDALYDWHRPWDEELQADWLEAVYTIFYSKPYIEGVSWYDFADFRTFIPNGGLIKVDGTKKMSFGRLKNLLTEWERLPEG